MAPRPRILKTHIRRAEPENSGVPGLHQPGDGESEVDPAFDEVLYLRAYPDIAEAVRRGVLVSGLAHFRETGRTEARLEKPEYRALLGARAGPAAPQIVVDTLTVSPSGSTLITGWCDDRLDTLIEIDLASRGETRHRWAAFPRLVRADVERTLDTASGHRFGFLLVGAPFDGAAAAADAPVFRFASGIEIQPRRREPVVVGDTELRDLALAALPTAAAGEQDPGAILGILDQHVGAQIAAINRSIVERARSNRLVEHFGPPPGRVLGSIITVLRGGADQIVPRLALIGAGAEAYEFIVVVPNADQFEAAMRAARLADATLGLTLTLVLQDGGDPADAGGDAALDAARSGRLIFMDQAVLPRERDWAARHSALLDDAPTEQTRLLGGMLYQPDGSLSNAGYYFEHETSLQPGSRNPPRRVTEFKLKAVTQPPRSGLGSSRAGWPVSGVPASFMSVDRAWFEALGGFTGLYSRAAYEDIDLCLRSFRRDVSAWVHHLPMWHFERHPPVRPEPSKGGAIFNSWLLRRQWDETIVADLPAGGR
jgi:hypothetical protein